MLKKKIYLFVLTVVAAMLGACVTDDMSGADRGDYDGEDERPVVFDISLPATRAIKNPKTKFTNGDVIHIEGTFQVKLDGQEELQTRIRYGAMEFDGKKWKPLDDSDLKWPNTAETGSFKAYFISGSTGILYRNSEGNSKTETYLLSQLSPNDTTPAGKKELLSDPLEAAIEDVEYGYAVELNFKHICAYLTLEELEPAVSDEYWFSTPDSSEPLLNAFYLSLNEDNTLEFHKTSVSEAGYNNGNELYCISGQAEESEEESETGAAKITFANYFLFPGDYSKFELSYPISRPTFNGDAVNTYGETLAYMSYDFDDIPKNEEDNNIRPVLEAGRTYVLNVTKSPGTTITIPPDGEGWDESDNYTPVDPKEFLEHVVNGTGYEKDGVQILERTAAGGTRLCRNVDFQHKNDYWESFQPSIPAGRTFDGDYHYIRNAGCQLFHFNDGTIKNLGIRDITVDFETYEDINKDNDMSHLGALCMYNHPTGIIENIRMDNVSVTARIKVVDDGSLELHNIGCILGSNEGLMSQAALSGTFTLTVEKSGNSSEDIDAAVIIGGIAGQNAGKAKIENVSSLDGALKVEIFNKCDGPKAAFYVGGIAGQSSGYIDSVILPDLTVDGHESSGNGSYMGGMVGELVVTASDENYNPDAKLSSCIVSGSVTPGEVKNSTDAASGLYTGGIAGAVNGIPVDDCRSAMTVNVPTETKTDVTYATGGAFGRIRKQTTIYNIIAYGTTLRGPAEYIGNFAGIVPADESWDTYSGNNIVVRSFGLYQNIGASIAQ